MILETIEIVVVLASGLAIIIGREILALIGAVSVAWQEVHHGRDVAVCDVCGSIDDVPADECPECGGPMTEFDHYRPESESGVET